MKTYAQALGIKQYNNHKENVEQKPINNSKKSLPRETINSNTKEIILALQDQVKQLKKLVMEMTNNVVMNENKKNEILNEMNQMKDIPIEEEEVEVEQVETSKREVKDTQ